MTLPRAARLLALAGSKQLAGRRWVSVMADPHTVWTLVEHLARRQEQAASVAWYADAEATSSATPRIDDDLVPGKKIVHASVEVAFRAHPQARHGRPIDSLGNNGDLWSLCSEGVTP